MSEPRQPGSEIRVGDTVMRRDAGTDEQGEVAELLPVYGGFQGGPDSVLLTAAWVRWKGTRQRTLVRVDDLIKVS